MPTNRLIKAAVVFIAFLAAVMLAMTTPAQAGILGDVGGILLNFSLLSIWKGLAGVALLFGGMYMATKVAGKIRFKIIAKAVAFNVWAASMAGAFLLLVEFQPLIQSAVHKTAVQTVELYEDLR